MFVFNSKRLGFHKDQAMVGNVAFMYMYNYVLTQHEVNGIYDGTDIPNDFIFNYRDVQAFEIVEAQIAEFPLADVISDGETVYFTSPLLI